ncbi:MAG TPA: pilus assembly protein TadG-related protein [Sphingomicrobium sp.]|nr:pilus assembly protein TadG-related protein [Sphingomicrobium sp.]
MSRHLFGRGGDKSAAVAPTVALSLFALIGAGGIAFDYARMASLDTELQNAADQSALAGATQLDQELGAIERATAAAQGLLVNETRMANDGAGAAIAVPTLFFYETKDDAENNTNAIDTSDANAYQLARFVRVRVAARRVDFALTPVVGAFTSGNLAAEAVAGLGSAICKTPPVMICNPNELTSGDFDPDDYAGVGIKLVSVGGSGGSWAPGNFGYLDSAGGSNGATGLREDLGWVNPPGECQPTSGVDTKPGASVSVTGSLNTRFDIYDGNVDCQSGGECPASINSLKDVKRPANASGGNACRLHNNGWQLDTSGNGYYGQTLPNSNAPLPATTTPSAMGHPRDICHAVSTSGVCAAGEHVGDGVWDRDAYFRTNYVRADGTAWTSAEWQTNTGLSPSVAATAPNYASRYNVYVWEIANEGDVVDGVTVLGQFDPAASGNTLKRYGTPVCSPDEGYGTGQVPGDDTPDRRRISVAVINCIAHGVAGNSVGVPVAHWMEAFLVEPSLNRARTGQGDVYIEVIQETDVGAGATAGQVIRRDVPYLVK